MKISFITTVYNEEQTISAFLDSILAQTLLPDENIIVDGGSTDKTIDRIKQYERRVRKSKLKITILVKNGNRSVGRNEAIRNAKGEIIVCSDAGNVLDRKWVEKITEPFQNAKVDVVAGYYQGIGKTVFQSCVIPYALVMPDKVDPKSFLPATRSVAFTKTIWETIGGFDERFSHNEDYVFARKLRRNGAKIVFARDAIVYWQPRSNFKQTFIMIYRFAYGDAEADIIRPKVILLFIRYIIGILLLISAILMRSKLLTSSLFFLFLLYLMWAAAKNYKYVKRWQAIFILPILQLIADWAVLKGTSLGLLKCKIDYSRS